MKGWLKPTPAAEYCGVCVRTFRPWLKKGLRHIRLPSGSILIKKEWIDDFLVSFEIVENRVDDLVDDIIGELND